MFLNVAFFSFIVKHLDLQSSYKREYTHDVMLLLLKISFFKNVNAFKMLLEYFLFKLLCVPWS